MCLISSVLGNSKIASLNAQLLVVGRTVGFTAALRKNLLLNDYPGVIEDLFALGVSVKLTREHYFVIDHHMRPSPRR